SDRRTLASSLSGSIRSTIAGVEHRDPIPIRQLGEAETDLFQIGIEQRHAMIQRADPGFDGVQRLVERGDDRSLAGLPTLGRVAGQLRVLVVNAEALDRGLTRVANNVASVQQAAT